MKRLMMMAMLAAVATMPLLATEEGSVSGTYVEARTAEVFAGGCVINSETGTAGRQAVLAWKIDRGAFGGVALDGLSIVAAVSADRNLGIEEHGGGKATTKAAVFVDERASAEQRTALIAMAGELSRGIVSTVVETTPTAVEFAESAHDIRVAAGDVKLLVSKHMNHETGCGAMQWFKPLSSVDQATMGTTEQHAFMGRSLGARWSDPDRHSSFFGTFSR
jgi:hypothetical protein